MSFSENLQYLRKRDRITQEELADKIGVSRQSVSKWETGEAYPETDKLIILCDMFNVSLDVMVRGDASAPAVKEKDNREIENDEPNRKKRKGASLKRRSETICWIVMISILAVYFVLGFVFDLWHPGWVVFPAGGIICAIINTVIGNKDSDDNGTCDDNDKEEK